MDYSDAQIEQACRDLLSSKVVEDKELRQVALVVLAFVDSLALFKTDNRWQPEYLSKEA